MKYNNKITNNINIQDKTNSSALSLQTQFHVNCHRTNKKRLRL